MGYTNCIHQSLGDAIGLENLKHLSPVHRIKGISEVNECIYCQQVSGSDPFINFSNSVRICAMVDLPVLNLDC